MIFGQRQPAPVQTQTPLSAGGAAADVIFDCGADDFEAKVLAVSIEKPVIVDFWAPWCGPCKQLVPVLEAAVRAKGGKIVMAKVNVDENQPLAQALRIQSIPAVFAFFQGRPVDAFQGALPESQIKAFIDKIVALAASAAPDALDIPESLKQAAALLAGGDLAGAQALYAAILAQDEKNVAAYAGLVRSFVAAGHIEQARHLVTQAPQEIAANPGFAEAQTVLELAEAAPQGSAAEYEQKLATNADDHQARYDLSLAYFSAGRRSEAVDCLLEIIRCNRSWNEDAARKQLVRFFEAMGQADPLTVESRKKLSSILFS